MIISSTPWECKTSVPDWAALLLAFSLPALHMLRTQQMPQWKNITKQNQKCQNYFSGFFLSQGSWCLYFWLFWQPQTLVFISIHFQVIIESFTNFSPSQQPSTSWLFSPSYLLAPVFPAHYYPTLSKWPKGIEKHTECWIHAQRALFCLDPCPSKSGCLRGTLIL